MAIPKGIENREAISNALKFIAGENKLILVNWPSGNAARTKVRGSQRYFSI
jgi:hypothetical protein